MHLEIYLLGGSDGTAEDVFSVRAEMRVLNSRTAWTTHVQTFQILGDRPMDTTSNRAVRVPYDQG